MVSRTHDDADDPLDSLLSGVHGRVTVHLAELLEASGMTLTEMAERVGITLANASILKNGHTRAIRFSTLAAVCHVLNCQPGDLLRWESPDSP